MASSYERLGTQDSSFIIFEGPGTHMHVSAVAVFEMGPLAGSEGSLDIDLLRRHVESRLHVIPRYRQRLQFTPLQRHPIWVDDERFNLVYHVRHTSLPHPGSEAQLKQLAGRIMSQQLDREKPLWEVWFVEGLEGGRFAMISKIHHCMVDGVSGVSVMTSLLSTSPDETVEPAQRWVPRPAPRTRDLLLDEIRHRLSTPLAALDAVRGAFQNPREASTSVAESADAMWQALNAGARIPEETPINRPIGTHRRIDWVDLDLDEIKDVKKRLDGTVNDVVLAVVTGALRSFLGERGADVESLDFRVVVPVNMRTDDAGATGNQVSAWFLSLPIAEGDPLKRFERVKEETGRMRESKAARGIELFTRITEWTGSDLLAYWGVRLAANLHPYNMIVTNVPGPRMPLYLLGARLGAMFPQLPLFENQGLGVAVMSYLDRVGFGVVADWDVVPDVGRFARAIGASFQELRAAAGR